MDLCPTTHHSVGDFRTRKNTGLGNREGRTASGDVFLGICLQAPPPRKPPGEGVDTEAGVCAASGTAQFGFRFPRKELELGGGERRESEET